MNILKEKFPGDHTFQLRITEPIQSWERRTHKLIRDIPMAEDADQHFVGFSVRPEEGYVDNFMASMTLVNEKVYAKS